MSKTIVAPATTLNNLTACTIPGCQLDRHDEAAPTLHQGVTKYTDTWSVTAMLDEADGRWEIDTVSTHRRDLTLEEAREFASAILMVASWCDIVSTTEVVSA